MMLAKFGDDETMNERLTSIDIYSLEHGILLKRMASSGKRIHAANSYGRKLLVNAATRARHTMSAHAYKQVKGKKKLQ